VNQTFPSVIDGPSTINEAPVSFGSFLEGAKPFGNRLLTSGVTSVGGGVVPMDELNSREADTFPDDGVSSTTETVKTVAESSPYLLSSAANYVLKSTTIIKGLSLRESNGVVFPSLFTIVDSNTSLVNSNQRYYQVQSAGRYQIILSFTSGVTLALKDKRIEFGISFARKTAFEQEFGEQYKELFSISRDLNNYVSLDSNNFRIPPLEEGDQIYPRIFALIGYTFTEGVELVTEIKRI